MLAVFGSARGGAASPNKKTPIVVPKANAASPNETSPRNTDGWKGLQDYPILPITEDERPQALTI